MRHDLEHLSIPNAVRNAAKKWPDGLALVDGPIRWTFRELEAQMIGSVRAAMAAGVGRGDRVALWAPNRAEWIIAALGIHGAGGVLVPVNTRFKAAEVAHVLTTSGARLLICVENFLGIDYVEILRTGAPEVASGLPIVTLDDTTRSDVIGWGDYLAGGSEVSEPDARRSIDAVGADDLSDIMFTSGTTGAPRGVQLTHGQSLRAYGWLAGRFTFRPGDKFLIIPPFFHTFGYKAGWLADVLYGVTTIPQITFDVEQILQRIQDEQVSILLGPPTLFIDLINHPRRSEFDLGSLRVTVPSAANVPVELIHQLRDVLGFEVVLSAYGLTEATSVVTSSAVDDDPDDVANSVGRPMDDTEVIVADPSGQPLPAGTAGEILVRGYNVMRGYWRDPQATAETIDAAGWLHTGDVGVFNERGFLTITDRLKDVVIVGGFNVYPAEVERLLQQHPAVSHAAVVGVPDPRHGEVTAAFVVAAPGREITTEEVIAAARESMANFKVPRYVEVVPDLPRNASLKVLKSELRDRARQFVSHAP